jgi:hypothetical protein
MAAEAKLYRLQIHRGNEISLHTIENQNDETKSSCTQIDELDGSMRCLTASLSDYCNRYPINSHAI